MLDYQRRDSSLPGQFVAAHRYYSMTGSVRQCVDLSPRAVARVAGILTTIPATDPNHQEVRTMSKCLACGAELEPPVRAPHTVYVKTLYRIAGQDYCRHHIIRAAVAAGVITEVKPGAGPVVVMPRGTRSAEYDRPHQY